MLDGMLFSGPLSQMKPGFTAVDTFESRYQDESGMYCGVFYTCFDVYCLHTFSKYIPL